MTYQDWLKSIEPVAGKKGIDNNMQNFSPGVPMSGVKPQSSIDLSSMISKGIGGDKGFFKNAGSPWAIGGAALNSIISGAIRPTEANMKFLSRNTGIAKSFDTANKINDIRGGISSLAISTGNPIAAGIGALDTIGRSVDKAAKDEFGIYKSTGAQIADRILDPIGNIVDLFGPSQKKLKKARDTFYNIETANTKADVRDLGAGTQSLLPKYAAPSYGSGTRFAGRGLKLRTKFSI